eukprot:m.238528 g.238528  ORF g.238528 m.238528 type:complete len:907 (+) comp21829_c0_seq1:164-2884(+)
MLSACSLMRAMYCVVVLVGGVFGSPLDENAAVGPVPFSVFVTLAATISLSVLIVSCAMCRRRPNNVLSTESSQATLTTPPNGARASHQAHANGDTTYEDVDQMFAAPSKHPAAQNPFVSGNNEPQRDPTTGGDLYTRPTKERSIANVATGQSDTDVTYSDAVPLSRSATGASSVIPPDRRRTQSQSEASRPLQYAVLDFHKDRQAGTPQPPPSPHSSTPVSPPATQTSAPPLPPPPAASAASTSTLAKSLSSEGRDDVYGNAASILTSTIVPRTAVELGSRIDGGQFGDVFRGTMTRNGVETDVAVKAVRMDTSESSEARRAFLEETATMAQLQHPNVVQLLAVVEDPLWLIMEFIKEGSVLAYVRAHPALPLPVLLQIATNTAAGLKYLHDHRVIHRDIAARNVLLQGSKADFIAKVGDLGMARIGEHYKGAAETPLPIRWCALESVYYGTFNRATDVWAFGVFLWELAAGGQFPYSDYTNDAELVGAIDKGVRLPQPHGTANDLYTLMCECWIADGLTRPSMTVVLEGLYRMQRSLSAFDPKVNTGEYQLTDGNHASDLILFSRYLSPPITEYRQVPDAPAPGLYIRIETFDGSVFRPARDGLAGQAYEAAVVRSRMVFSPLLADELRPSGMLYVLRDKGSAHAQLNRRRHLTRAAVETTHADPDVYTLVQKNTSSAGRGRLPTRSVSDDDGASSSPAPVHRTRLNSTSHLEDPEESMAVNRRRTQSSASALPLPGPPLPARATTRPVSTMETSAPPPLPRSQSSRAGSTGQAPAEAGRLSAGARHPDADQLTAIEWQHVEDWLSRSVSRTQAEQSLMASHMLGAYLVRRSERAANEMALSVRGSRNVQHYKLLNDDGQVAMVDAANGNKKFASLQSLLSFYKLLEPKALGGLCARLSVCLKPS